MPNRSLHRQVLSRQCPTGHRQPQHAGTACPRAEYVERRRQFLPGFYRMASATSAALDPVEQQWLSSNTGLVAQAQAALVGNS
jgi:hypothetical protein